MTSIAFASTHEVRTQLERELHRIGMRVDDEQLEPLVAVVDGWPRLIPLVAKGARTLGVQTTLDRIARVAYDTSAAREEFEAAYKMLDAPARSLAASMSLARGWLRTRDIAELSSNAQEALDSLVSREWVIVDADRARVRQPLAYLIRSKSRGPSASAAKERFASMVLAHAEETAAQHRRAPEVAIGQLRKAVSDLEHVAATGTPMQRVRAVLALEPWLAGLLDRERALRLFDAAKRAASALDAATRHRVVLGLARTLIARGEHELAERQLLAITGARSKRASSKHNELRRDLYLGHIAAWRQELTEAATLFERVQAGLEVTPEPDIEDDLIGQWIFVAYQRRDLTLTARLAREAVTRGTARPTPRMVTLARRYIAEVDLLRDRAARAWPLFERCAVELSAHGDDAGALFMRSRMVAALIAAGEHERAEQQAELAQALAANASEHALELAFVTNARSPSRVRDLAWRAQIPVVRERAEQWLRAQSDTVEPELVLEDRTLRVSLSGETTSLASREVLYRVLRALALHHRRAAPLAAQALFQAGWPGEKVRVDSQRQRVQTAIWTLRKTLLGALLETTPDGYRLAARMRTEVR